MPSPFPGMNPYLEQSDTWEDFHHRFIGGAADALGRQVGHNYLVRIETRLHVHELSEDERHFLGKADAAVIERATPATTRASGTAMLTAPMQLYLPEVETIRESFLEIRDRRDRRVVTVLELVSPANKTGTDHLAYVGKRQSLLRSQTNLVEIDLRRGGIRPQMPELPACDYYVLVSRYYERPKIGLWPLGLRDRLPEVPIPLTPPDADISLDLQALLQQVFEAADYGREIYALQPQPPLLPADEAWARKLIPKPN